MTFEILTEEQQRFYTTTLPNGMQHELFFDNGKLVSEHIYNLERMKIGLSERQEEMLGVRFFYDNDMSARRTHPDDKGHFSFSIGDKEFVNNLITVHILPDDVLKIERPHETGMHIFSFNKHYIYKECDTNMSRLVNGFETNGRFWWGHGDHKSFENKEDHFLSYVY
jgi:hypothetical protein